MNDRPSNLSKSLLPSSFSAPPPPPLPQKWPFSSKPSEKTCETKAKTTANDDAEIRELLEKAHLFFGMNEEEIKQYNKISMFNHAPSILQEGPTCGLVAAQIAAASIGIADVSVHDLLNIALKMNFTKQGEMFSAKNLAKILEKAMPVIVEVKQLINCDTDQILSVIPILNHLHNGWPILIPYDADFNHQPCNKLGYRAHWAVLLGFCLLAPIENNLLISDCDKDAFSDQLFYYRKASGEFLNAEPDLSEKLVGFYAKQGKSKHIHGFRCDILRESNLQLKKANPEKSIDMIIPEESINKSLSNQVLFVKPIRII